MTEADLRVHFADQLGGEVGGLDLTTLRAGGGGAALARLQSSGAPAFVVDALHNDDLRDVATLLLAGSEDCLFAVGSGGLSTGLAAARGSAHGGAPGKAPPRGPAGAPPACLVVSGSAAGRTSEQIDRAVASGWTAIPLDPARLDSPDHTRAAGEETTRAVIDAFDRTRGVVVYTAHRTRLPPAGSAPSAAVGAALGEVVLAVRRLIHIPRVLVAGGDTSGYVLTRLRATTLSALGTVGDDLLLGMLTSTEDAVDGLQVVLKGGQLGGPDVFEEALRTAV